MQTAIVVAFKIGWCARVLFLFPLGIKGDGLRMGPTVFSLAIEAERPNSKAKLVLNS